MQRGEVWQVLLYAVAVTGSERARGSHRTVESKDATHAVFLHRFLQGDLQRHLACLDHVAIHDNLAMLEQVIVDHLGRHHRDHDLVVANDAAPGGIGKAQGMDDRAIDLRPVHRIDQRAIAFLVLLANVVVARGGREEQPLANRQVGVFQGKAETGSLAAGGLVGFIKDGQVKGLHLPVRTNGHARRYHLRRLVSGKDDLDAIERLADEAADDGAVCGDRKIEVRLVDDQIVSPLGDRGVRADTHEAESLPGSFAQPLVQQLAHQRQ